MRQKKLVWAVVAVLTVLIVHLKLQTITKAFYSQDDKQRSEKSLSRMIDVIDEINERRSKNVGDDRKQDNLIEIEQYYIFLQRIQDFQNVSRIHTICEFGFGSGQNAAIFLTEIDPELYIVFDKSADHLLNTDEFKHLKEKFYKSKINITSVDTFENMDDNVSCDLIHVNAELIISDLMRVMKNLFYIASERNLLLISSRNEALRGVMNGIEFLKRCNVVNDIKKYISKSKLEISWYSGSFKPPVSDFVFLNKTFCNPFFEKKNGVCVKSVLKPCSTTSNECFYNREIGVVSISCEVWRKAQKSEKNIWVSAAVNSDRNAGHTLSFNNYQDIPKHLGDVLELGSGPFTQSQSILSTKTADSITLVEPMAFQYIQSVQHCFYKNGMFKNLPTTICSIPAEEFRTNVTFDTVIMINVIEHVYDALPLLNAAVQLVKVGGLFIWQEKAWDKLIGMPHPGSPILDFYLHPIRIKTPILKQVISGFEEIFASTDAPELRKYGHQGIYFIGRKRNDPMHSVLPKRKPCTQNRSSGSVVIIFTAPSNDTVSLDQIKIAENSSYTKSIILILTSAFKNASLSKLIRFSKIKAVVSHHNIQQWQKQILLFTTPCGVIQPTLTDNILQTFSTVCIGQ